MIAFLTTVAALTADAASAQTSGYYARQMLKGVQKPAAATPAGIVCGPALANTFSSRTTTAEEIQNGANDMSMCQKNATATGKAGTCSWNVGARRLYYYPDVVTTQTSINGNMTMICK